MESKKAEADSNESIKAELLPRIERLESALFQEQHRPVRPGVIRGSHNLTGRAAELAGISPQTARNYCCKGLISPDRDSSGRRVFSDADILQMRQIFLDNMTRCGR